LDVAIGVDSHKSTLAAAAVDELGRVLDARQFTNDGRGHEALREWVTTQGAPRTVGIECSGTFGAGLARLLIAASEDVREVPPNLSHREARRQSTGKSDPVDALAIARVVARERNLPSPRRVAVLDDLKVLCDHRDQLVRERTRLCNRIHRDLVVIRPGYERHVPRVLGKKNLASVMTMLRGDASVRAGLIRERIGEIRRLDDRVAKLETEIAVKLRESGSRLPTLRGIGALTAAKILGEVGDVSRLRSAPAFARLAGTAPLSASSGSTNRHRLNRGGNRQLNLALHCIALTRYRYDPETRAYVERRRAEGKSFKEALRCLKRHLANVVYRQMTADLRGSMAT
jgi:transposase